MIIFYSSLQRDTTGLTTENKELKLRLQALEQQAHLRDALNETLREEVQRLRIAAGEMPPTNRNPFRRTLTTQFSSQQQPPPPHGFGTNQTQQQHQQQGLPPQSPPNNQSLNAPPRPIFSNFGQ
ncbi:Transcription factor VIP1 [Linum perenne]